MAWTKIRAFIGTVFAIALLVVMFYAFAVYLGWDIPGVGYAQKLLGGAAE